MCRGHKFKHGLLNLFIRHRYTMWEQFTINLRTSRKKNCQREISAEKFASRTWIRNKFLTFGNLKCDGTRLSSHESIADGGWCVRGVGHAFARQERTAMIVMMRWLANYNLKGGDHPSISKCEFIQSRLFLFLHELTWVLGDQDLTAVATPPIKPPPEAGTSTKST